MATLCNDNEWTQLIDKPSLVDKEYPQSYSQQVDIKGACPLFGSTVLSHNDEKWNEKKRAWEDDLLSRLNEEQRRSEENLRRIKVMKWWLVEVEKRAAEESSWGRILALQTKLNLIVNGGSAYLSSSPGSSGGAPGGHCGTNGAGGGFNHDGSGLRTRPGGTGTADGGSSGCSYGSSGSSGCAPGNHCGTNGACGGSEETPNDHSGSSGNSGFPGSPGMLHSTPDGTGRPDGLLAHGYITGECVCAGQQNCTVTLEVGRRDSFDSASMVSGDGSRWEDVPPLLKEDKGLSPVMEARLMPFGRELCCWKVDHDTSLVQAIDLKSVDQGRTVSISWKLGNTEPGRMADLQCAVEMCQHRMNQYGAIDKTERTKFPLMLHACDLSSANAHARNKHDSPRAGIPSVGEHEHILPFFLEMVDQQQKILDETALRLSRLEHRDAKREDEISTIRQQLEMDNRRIADLENFKEKFAQMQPSSDD